MLLVLIAAHPTLRNVRALRRRQCDVIEYLWIIYRVSTCYPIAMRIQSAIGLISHPCRGSDAIDLQNCHNA